MGKLRIDVLGESFTVQAQEDDEYLKKLLSYYKAITSTIEAEGGMNNPLKISILAGITLVDELYKEKQKSVTKDHTHAEEENHQAEEVERLTMEMIQKIDNVL